MHQSEAMQPRRCVTRSLLFTLLLLFSAILAPVGLIETSADAHLLSRTTGAHVIGAATWAVVANSRNQVLTRAPYVLQWTSRQGTVYDYVRLLNAGTTQIRGIRLLISQAIGKGNNQEIFFERCNGSWHPTTSACQPPQQGTALITEIGRASQGLITLTNLNLGMGDFIEIRARTASSGQNDPPTSLTTEITRAQVPPAGIRNS